jgi:Flp pilus assembly protein TadG
MLMRRQRRSGSALVETAIVYPVLFLLILGIIMIGIAVFRYQQVAHAAREGARWAAVHGAKYAEETGNTAATDQDIFDNAIHPQLAKIDTANITYSVTWNTSNKQTRPYVYTDPVTGVSRVREVANTVSVTVQYSWDTGFFGVIPVSSTTVMTMSY